MSSEGRQLRNPFMIKRRNSASYVTRFGSNIETIKMSGNCDVKSEGTQTDLNSEMIKGFNLLKYVLLELTNRRMH